MRAPPNQWIALLVSLFVLGACATQRPARNPPPQASPPSGVRGSEESAAILAERIERASALATLEKNEEADTLLRGVMASPQFASLDGVKRHFALRLGGTVAWRLHDPQRGRDLVRRASEMPETDSLDWIFRVWDAVATEDAADAAAALGVLARRWPETLAKLDPDVLARAVAGVREHGSADERYLVLSALRNAHFFPEPEEASVWWRDLALLQLARGETLAAAATTVRITDAYIVISVEADKRFDPIRNDLGTALDVSRTAERAIAAALAEAQKDPGSLKPINRLVYLLRHSLRFQQALQVADTAIEREEAHGRDVYRDYDREYVWILNDRAYALFGLGRWDAAVIQMETASRMRESRDPNVSQTLNLALMYSEVGRPADALAALERAGRASAYGNTVAQGARLKAAVQLNDTSAVREALRFLSDHRHDSISGYQEALLDADREEDGARLLISRLADPRLRSGALLAVQQYREEGLPAPVVLEKQRWHALLARPDVQKAIRAVGYVKRYPLMQSDY